MKEIHILKKKLKEKNVGPRSYAVIDGYTRRSTQKVLLFCSRECRVAALTFLK